jgi:DNA polymerase elongation subunit (family B)
LKFYTHVARVWDKIFIRGYEDGRRFQDQIEYQPHIFITSNTQSEYKTLDGTPVSKIHPGSMRETVSYVEKYKNVAGHDVYGYGQESFHYQYINEEFPGEVNYDPTLISVVTLDIETDSSGGFPNIKTADKALTAITIRKNDRAITFGMQPYTPELDYVTYIECVSERAMIERFLEVWNSPEWLPDVLTGWNVEFFDVPYLINRITRLFDEAMAKRLSPWRMWEKRRDPNIKDPASKEDGYMNMPLGINVLDYLQLYKKFSFQNQESFKLDHIAFVELGERKLDYTELGFESLDEFYKGDFRNYINYNIRDVDLVYKLDKKMKLLEQVYAIAYDGKVNMIDSLTTVSMWDVIIHNYLYSQNIVIPHKERGNKPRQIEGAYVKDPQTGLHEWVVSFDLNSLYPHLIMQYNISPETMKGQMLEYDLAITTTSVDKFLDGELDRVRDESERQRSLESIRAEAEGLVAQEIVEGSKLQLTMQSAEYFAKFETIREILDKHNLTIAPTGCLFDRSTRGFLPTLMEKMYDDRAVWKQRMLEAKKAYEKTPTRDLQNEIARCQNMQLAKKIQLNSAYGALSNQYFRWFDNRLAESITKSGQLSIRWMERKMNGYLNAMLKTDDDYVIAIDTDSMYIRLGPMLEKICPNRGKRSNVEYLDRACSEIMEPFIDKSYEQLAVYVNAYEQKMKMKREAIANKGIWTGKKHYILNVYDLEGVRYEAPKLKMQGIEAVRSSTPAACRDYIKKSLDIIMNSNEPALHEFIKNARTTFRQLPFEDVAFPRSVRGLIRNDVFNKDGTIAQKSYYTGDATFKKSTPIHVKGALLYNRLLDKKGLTSKYPLIGEGEKIKFCYVLDSAPLPTNVIATSGKMPKELDLDRYIDYTTQFDKAFIEPLRTILDAIGWTDGSQQQLTIESFFE